MVDVEAKLLNAPFDTVMSPTAKFVVASLDVKVSAMDASFVVEPSETPFVVDVIAPLRQLAGRATPKTLFFPSNGCSGASV